MTVATCVCCSITSLTQMGYAARLRRQGRSRAARSNHVASRRRTQARNGPGISAGTGARGEGDTWEVGQKRTGQARHREPARATRYGSRCSALAEPLLVAIEDRLRGGLRGAARRLLLLFLLGRLGLGPGRGGGSLRRGGLRRLHDRHLHDRAAAGDFALVLGGADHGLTLRVLLVQREEQGGRVVFGHG